MCSQADVGMLSSMAGAEPQTVTERVDVGAWELVVERPRSAEDLLDEEAFERDEFLPYWAELWPSGLALARHVATLTLRGRRVLELGCGLGLPAVAAALTGAYAVASDWSTDALAAARRNAALNGVEVETALVRWDDSSALAGRAAFDLVLAADVLYERRNGEQLLALLSNALASGGEALVADPGRPHTKRFIAAAAAAWTVDTMPRSELARGGIYRLRRRL